MKIIFLDVDGVLNYYSFHKNSEKIVSVDDECIKNLREIINKTGAKVVLSSSWRLSQNKIDFLERKIGIRFYDILGSDCYKSGDNITWLTRGQLIRNWLSDNQCDKYVILDDENDDMDNMLLVKTNYFTDGLNQTLTQTAINMLR